MSWTTDRPCRPGTMWLAMGQTVAVVEKPSSQLGVRRFELNRSLTGMAHERYESQEDAIGNRPPDLLARRLFAEAGAAWVHIYSNQVTVGFYDGENPEGLTDLIRGLYTHYIEGVIPKKF